MDEMRKLSDEELEQVSGGWIEEPVTTDCLYCGCNHLLNCVNGVKITPHGMKIF